MTRAAVWMNVRAVDKTASVTAPARRLLRSGRVCSVQERRKPLRIRPSMIRLAVTRSTRMSWTSSDSVMPRPLLWTRSKRFLQRHACSRGTGATKSEDHQHRVATNNRAGSRKRNRFLDIRSIIVNKPAITRIKPANLSSFATAVKPVIN